MDRVADAARNEDARIKAGTDADPETWDMSEEDWSQAWAGDPMDILKHLERVVILDDDIAAKFAERGGDWRAAVNAALRKLIEAETA